MSSSGVWKAARAQWRVAAPKPEIEQRLRGELNCSPLLARLLVNRGIEDPAAAAVYLDGRLSEHLRSPMLFRDMGRAAERLAAAVARGERIGVHGDYDVDGISGSAVLLRFFRALGADPVLHIPHRLREGYGLNETGVRRLAEAGARVMITVDCGAVSHRELELAGRLGMDAVVCDHHQVSETPLPALAVLNPIEATGGFPFRGLCGAGVAFYLALGVRMQLRESGATALPDLRRSLDLVALGTIADLVPIVEENRVLVKYGLRELANSQQPGVVALKAVSGVHAMSTGAVGFRLAPRLNAGGRLDDATRCVELLTTTDRAQAERLATGLDEENRARQVIERQIVDEALAQVEAQGGIGDRAGLVLASPEWHHGVVGIVAARLVERYYRPTVVIASAGAQGLGRGSGRSIRGVDIHDVLRACRDHLVGFGGHRMAAGLSIRPEQIEAFAAAFSAAVAARTQAADFIPVREVDCELSLRDIDADCLAAIERLEPHGQANPEPVFVSRAVRVRSRRIVGETHLKVSVEGDGRTIPAIGFGMAERAVEVGDCVDVLYSPMLNEWNGSVAVELRLRDIRPHQGRTPVNPP